jgi:hypothetical protein
MTAQIEVDQKKGTSLGLATDSTSKTSGMDPLLIFITIRLKLVQKHFLNFLPEFMGVFWIVLLAGLIWRHTSASTRLPIYDAFSYYQKAYNFWHLIGTGVIFNPFDVPPVMRPPGTVLMSYPAGFSEDPRSFFFRSVFVPAALLFISPLVAIYKPSASRSFRWTLISCGILLSTMTMLYQFDFDAGYASYWGMVDGFLTGLSALAAAFVWRATWSTGQAWRLLSCAVFLFCLGITVKPAGVFVAAIGSLIWAFLSICAIFASPNRKGRTGLFKTFLTTGITIAAVEGLLVLVCLRSAYLSAENFALGNATIAMMKIEFGFNPSLLWTILKYGLGPGLLFSYVLLAYSNVTALFFQGVNARESVAAFCAAFLTLIFGIWFWLVYTAGFAQIRYGMPFFAMGWIWLLPALFREKNLPAARYLLSTVAFLISLNLAAVLWLPNPSKSWQGESGLGITSDFPSGTVSALKSFESSTAATSPVVYSVAFDTSDAILTSFVLRQQLVQQDLGTTTIIRPVDWIRPSTVRVSELLAANYVMFNVSQSSADYLSRANSVVSNLQDEQAALTSWLTTLGPDDGVHTTLNSAPIYIVKIDDRRAFCRGLVMFISKYRWDKNFVDANAKFVEPNYNCS